MVKHRTRVAGEYSLPTSLAALFAAALTTACNRSTECSLEVVEPPVVRIVDARTGKPICDANALIVHFDPEGVGSGPALVASASHIVDAGVDGLPALTSFVPPDAAAPLGCVYESSLPEYGSFTLQVTRPGYAPVEVENVYPVAGDCADPSSPAEMVTVSLQPLHP